MKFKVLLYGIGIGSGTIEQLLDEDKVEIIGYILDKEYITDRMINGRKIYMPNELKGIDYDYIIMSISSLYLDRLKQRLIDYGVCEEKILFTDVNESNLFKQFLFNVQKEYRKLFKIDTINNLFKTAVYEDAYICNMNRAHQFRRIHNFEGDYIRLSTLELLARIIYNRQIPGSVAELGVYKGEFAKYINQLFPDRKLYLFDTFEGFNKTDIEIDKGKNFSRNIHNQFKDTSESYVLSKMVYPQNCIVKKGYFPLTALDVDDVFSFVSIDTDLYKPIYDGLEYFYPRLSNGGYILVHDYFNSSFKGTREAVDEFCEKHSISFAPVSDEYGSVIITKNGN
ncbi:TylF/MycF/NovP-related O-methyltransferase [Thermaerobacillus caldiproteolyticus]|uniref:TylF/MycF/NovP-related O-methyltransferase n=1 Tax=Thermaerobacillus caldiproteolyticus TaxID=247480 RepID=UPI00188D3098|nr:TylF/MycF/NovP-related O-methyltransferase [Anoxybacillus caldiproteolyticus]QPA30696.1 class I SAM-dependent methyltransferase [Anoxybacillus caldiproteolyticus]